MTQFDPILGLPTVIANGATASLANLAEATIALRADFDDNAVFDVQATVDGQNYVALGGIRTTDDANLYISEDTRITDWNIEIVIVTGTQTALKVKNMSGAAHAIRYRVRRL